VVRRQRYGQKLGEPNGDSNLSNFVHNQTNSNLGSKFVLKKISFFVIDRASPYDVNSYSVTLNPPMSGRVTRKGLKISYIGGRGDSLTPKPPNTNAPGRRNFPSTMAGGV
jgi:hypothetical protein